jgi:hypothetical protein
METSTVVFLFDSQAKGVSDWYGGEFDPAFLRALSVADPKGITQSSVLRGDAIVENLAIKVSNAASDGRSSSYTQSHDMELYRTIIWDFADALSLQWHTVDDEAFPLILGACGLHCIAVTTLPVNFRGVIDCQLRRTNGYIGAIELDLGNPIQRIVFVDYLIKDAVIFSGKVVLELSWDGSADTIFEGANVFQPDGLTHVAYGQLESLRPAIPIPQHPSPRGQVSLERYNGKRRFSLQERVIAALAYRTPPTGGLVPFNISATVDLSYPLEANLPKAKFVNYLLNLDHPKGGSKAKFFYETLGIGLDDWRNLAAQFHDGLSKAELVEIGIKNWQDGFGVSFNAVIPILGSNGRTVDIDTNWIMEPGKQPRLSTAVPAKKSSITGQLGTASQVVPSNVQGIARWQTIFDLASQAGHSATLITVPTPMRVQSFRIEMEGLCGSAWIRVTDARKGFTKWAIANDHANSHYKSGALFFAKVSSQSVDRAKAYADAFAVVLQHNGIECKVESRLD